MGGVEKRYHEQIFALDERRTISSNMNVFSILLQAAFTEQFQSLSTEY